METSRGEPREGWTPIFTAKVEKRHRIWIPKTIRELANISEGDYVEVSLRPVRKRGKILRV